MERGKLFLPTSAQGSTASIMLSGGVRGGRHHVLALLLSHGTFALSVLSDVHRGGETRGLPRGRLTLNAYARFTPLTHYAIPRAT
jgi:hypothetical protein